MPRISNIDLRLLNVFIKVVECGGYSAAQAELNIGLATVSSHMKALEERIGICLCQRGRAGFKLTEEGQIVYNEAILLRNSIERFSSLSQVLGAELSGKLQIGIVDTITTARSMLISNTVRRFNERDNNIEIHLHIGSRQELEKAVLDGQYDLAIGPFATHYSGLKVHPLYKEPHALYCGDGHALFNQDKAIIVDDFSEIPIVVRGYAIIDDRERIGSHNRRAVVYNLEAQLALLLSGSYIGYLPVQYAAPWVESKQLRPLNLPRLNYDSEHVLISKKKRSLSKKVEIFVKDLLKINSQ